MNPISSFAYSFRWLPPQLAEFLFCVCLMGKAASIFSWIDLTFLAGCGKIVTLRRCGIMVALLLPKQTTRVRFPSPAPRKKSDYGVCCDHSFCWVGAKAHRKLHKVIRQGVLFLLQKAPLLPRCGNSPPKNPPLRKGRVLQEHRQGPCSCNRGRRPLDPRRLLEKAGENFCFCWGGLFAK